MENKGARVSVFTRPFAGLQGPPKVGGAGRFDQGQRVGRWNEDRVTVTEVEAESPFLTGQNASADEPYRNAHSLPLEDLGQQLAQVEG